jgi:hypothetical protein
MPKSEETAAEFKSLQDLAIQLDAEGEVDLPDAKKVGKPQLPPVQDEEPEVPEAPEDKSADTADTEPEEEVEDKDKSRLARNWKEFQKEKEESRARIAALEERTKKAEEEVTKLRSRPAEIPHKDRRGHTVEDYEGFAAQCEKDGDYEKARNLREEANYLRGEISKAEFLSGWQATQQKMVEENPDLGNLQSDLAKEVNKLISDPESIFITRPTGLRDAVKQAKSNLLADSISTVKEENLKLKKELDRVTKLSAIPGKDGAMKRVGDKAFKDMTLAEQKSHLLTLAEEADAEAMRY